MGNSLGGQSINAFDYAMAEGVKKSFKKAVIKYGSNNFRKEILDICDSKDELNTKEKY